MIWFFLLLSVTITYGKVYDRCELARELKFVHKAPSHQLATWVCIAEHESLFNTSIVGHLSGDGSGDHGLFQISDKFWCSPPGKGNACGLTCADLEDDDITDDFICAQTIYKEHKQLSGDGFNAWAVYKPLCKGPKSERYIKDCFNESEDSNTIPANLPPSSPFNFAHGFFGKATGKEKSFSTKTTTERTFDAFFTPEPVKTSFFNPTVGTTNYFTPTISTSSVYVPTTSRPALSTLVSRRLNIFNPTRTTISNFPSAASGSSFFNTPSNSFFTPSTSSIFFTPTTSTFYTSSTTGDFVNEPIFIINGVKWY